MRNKGRVNSVNQQDFLSEGGLMGELMREYRWNSHPLGDPEKWPQSLKTLTKLILHSALPMAIWWSKDLYLIYNDPFIPALGDKHPEVLGADGSLIWKDIWPQQVSLMEEILSEGKSFYTENLMLPLKRDGNNEETYWTFSCSPAHDTDGNIRGVFCTCFEESKRVLDDRRILTLKNIAGVNAQAMTIEKVSKEIFGIIEKNEIDIPFALIYLIDEKEEFASLLGKSRKLPHSAAPLLISLKSPSMDKQLPLAKIMENNKSLIIDDFANNYWSTYDSLNQLIDKVVIMPIFKYGKEYLSGFFISGINPRLNFDINYRNYLELVAGKLELLLTSIRAQQAELKCLNTLEEVDRIKNIYFKSEELFRTTFEGAAVAVIITDLKGSFLKANKSATKIFGYSEEELISLSVADITHPKDRKKSYDLMNSLKDGELSSYVFEKRYIRKDKTVVWAQASIAILKDQQDHPLNFVAVIEDITDRKRMQSILQGQKLALEKAVNGESREVVLEIIALTAEEQSSNKLFASILLLESDGKYLIHAAAPSISKSYTDVIDRIPVNAGSPFGATAISGKDVMIDDIGKDPLWNDFKDIALSNKLRACWSTPIWSSKGSLLGVFVLYYSEINSPDIHDKEMADLLSRTAGIVIEWHLDILKRMQSEERLSFAMTASELVGTYDWHIQPNLIYADKKFNSLFSVDSGNAEKGRPMEEYLKCIHPDDIGKLRREMNHTLKTGEKFFLEYRIIQQDGKVNWVIGRGECLFDDEGQPWRFTGVVVDITERKRVEDALRESEEHLKALVMASSEVIYRMSANWETMIYLDGRNFLIDTGVPIHDWLEKYIPVDHQKMVLEEIENAVKEKRVFQLEHHVVRSDGSIGWTFSRAIPIINNKGEILEWFGAASDVTERKRHERVLLQSEEHFRTFANNIQNLAWITDPKGWTYWYNERWYNYTGTTFDEMEGWGWKKVHHPDHINRVVQFIREALKEDQPWELTYPLRSKSGEYRWFLSRAYPVKNDEDKIIRWIGTNTDIDNQKKAEAALAESNIELIKINNDLDNFIYTASHDLKAPVINLEGLFTAFLSEIELSDDLTAIKSMIDASFATFKSTIRDLTEIIKVQKGSSADDQEVIKFSEIIEEVKLGIKDQIEKNEAEIKTSLDVEEIKFSRKNLRSVFYNFISNGIKYADPKRKSIIEISTTKSDGFVLVTFTDNGLGISEENRAKMFSMFKRFHDHVEGTGIGLYIVKRIVDNAGGKIEVESKLGKGSSFKVYLKKLSQ
ncbi:MAG: PAS domain S-box protein [Sporocytophaga sp.]|uniref:PAS domain S-box protein n=1 Tax=Sporocytophaga sp. TaxID=2231183 RepID=UPI001B14C07F|nr:PAS domain S-box protein [Sporocytophaga sp.]MBO9699038.1 PAS domain S-box protein [Sporocytophaga sp.]